MLCVERGREKGERDGIKVGYGKCGVFVFLWRVEKENMGDEDSTSSCLPIEPHSIV